MLQDFAHAGPKPGSEAFEDEMWVRFGDCTACAIGDVVAQDDVV